MADDENRSGSGDDEPELDAEEEEEEQEEENKSKKDSSKKKRKVACLFISSLRSSRQDSQQQDDVDEDEDDEDEEEEPQVRGGKKRKRKKGILKLNYLFLLSGEIILIFWLDAGINDPKYFLDLEAEVDEDENEDEDEDEGGLIQPDDAHSEDEEVSWRKKRKGGFIVLLFRDCTSAHYIRLESPSPVWSLMSGKFF